MKDIIIVYSCATNSVTCTFIHILCVSDTTFIDSLPQLELFVIQRYDAATEL